MVGNKPTTPGVFISNHCPPWAIRNEEQVQYIMQVASGDTVQVGVLNQIEFASMYVVLGCFIFITIMAILRHGQSNRQQQYAKHSSEVPPAESLPNWARQCPGASQALNDGQGPYPASAFTPDNTMSQPEEGEPYDDEDDDGLDDDPNEEYPRAEEFDPYLDPDDEDDYPDDDEDNLAEILHG